MSRSSYTPSPTNPLLNGHQGPVADGTSHRREAHTKSKDMKPLLTHEPLAQYREKTQTAPPPKKRKRPEPSTPALTFHPRDSIIPSGRLNPSAPTPTSPRPSLSDSSTSGSLDSLHVTAYNEPEALDRPYNPEPVYDAHKRPRIFADYPPIVQPTSPFTATPATDMTDMNSASVEFYDSPVSCTSSSSPSTSDQSPTRANHFTVQTEGYACHSTAPQEMHSYDNRMFIHPTVVYPQPYLYPVDPRQDRAPQNYPVHQFIPPNPTYVEAAPHVAHGHSEYTGYYPPQGC
ncbi:hypothetical protein HYDPIDRAFT_26063 [Hydnomerulius pinastri MD-312]|nr:hypothetical protein HYDPIDRAFT_26063 [Hydnomerulius pinastri MD-312]